MNVLVACEESQAVCKAFREKGHEAYSCDIQECSGGHNEWHIQSDVLNVINPKSHPFNVGFEKEEYILESGIKFQTMDGTEHFIEGKWDLIIAHPPCTYLTGAGACNIPKHPERIPLGFEAAEFFKKILNADCDKIVVENPPPMKRFNLPKYSQLVRPYMFGESNNKPICLWLKGVQELKPTNIVEKDKDIVRWVHKATGQKKSCSKWYNTNTNQHNKHRSKTFEGVAKAMADQWG
jgi:hypothetical protein